MTIKRIDRLELDIDTRLSDLWQELWASNDFAAIHADERNREIFAVTRQDPPLPTTRRARTRSRPVAGAGRAAARQRAGGVVRVVVDSPAGAASSRRGTDCRKVA
jgi:hypothetical protein